MKHTKVLKWLLLTPVMLTMWEISYYVITLRDAIYSHNDCETSDITYIKEATRDSTLSIVSININETEIIHGHVCKNLTMMDLHDNNLLSTSGKWQKVRDTEINGSESFVYSAFWEDRLTQPLIRVIGMVLKDKQIPIYCQIWYESEPLPHVTPAQIQLIGPNKLYRQAILYPYICVFIPGLICIRHRWEGEMGSSQHKSPHQARAFRCEMG